ncbi:MAG TPA: NADH-quinone oxidoreductase subunit K [Candidatus Limnocylindrales bacterium]|nr:NADH-quinone oxidoreductase subunit K [Candidatus Limnocylindrales bacterium]
MELVMALLISVMFGAGTYTILRPSLIRIVMGFGLYGNAVNLLLITCGGYSLQLQAPFAGDGADPSRLMDPLPPDIILTAIVINFAVTAFLLVLCYCVYRDCGSDDPSQIRTQPEPR